MNGPGEIFIESSLPEEGRITLTFRDTGPGFSEDTLSKAMDPFFTTKDNGTGLGLPIVQAIIDSHGGSMRLSNATQGGALISISLPAQKSETDQGTDHE